MSQNSIITGMPAEQYHAHPAISKSGLSEFQRSPAHYQYWREHDALDSDALRIGSAFHTMLLEPETEALRIHVWEKQPRNTKAGKEAYEAATALAGDRLLLSRQEHGSLKEMAQSIASHVSARVILDGEGDVEASMFWLDAVTGVQCRARADWIRADGLIVDLKTCNDARPFIFERDAFKFLYHWQAAMYVDGYEAATGKKAAGFAFVAVEKEAPYGVSTFIADEQFIELGRLQYREALARFAECNRMNLWPKYEDSLIPLSLPAWVEKRLTYGEHINV